MKISFLSLLLLALLSSDIALALEVQSRADGSVSITGLKPHSEDAAVLWLIPVTSPTVGERRVALDDAEEVEVVEQTDGLVLRNATGGGRYRELLVIRKGQGGSQILRIGLNIPSATNLVALSGLGAETSKGRSLKASSVSSEAGPQAMPFEQAQKGRPALIDAELLSRALGTNRSGEESLAGTSMVNTRMQDCNFAERHLMRSRLVNAQFIRCDFSRSDLSDARLVNVSFSDSDLSGARLQSAELINVSFERTRLDGAIWTDGRICAENSMGLCR